MDIIKSLGIGKWKAALAFAIDGWAGLAKLACGAYSKLLRKADPSKLREYSELAAKIAGFIRTGIDLFVKNYTVRAAASATAQSIENHAAHIADGNYDEKELDADIDAIEDCVEKWKAVSK